MPLQASTTFSVCCGRMRTLPSRITGICSRSMASSATRLANNLQRERDLVVDDRRNRHHEKQQEERKAEDLEVARASQQQHGADDREHQRGAGQEKLRAQRGDVKLKARPKHDGEAPPVRYRGYVRDLVAFLPGDKAGNHRDEETVPHVGVAIPLTDERRQNGRITDGEEDRNPGYRGPGKRRGLWAGALICGQGGRHRR